MRLLPSQHETARQLRLTARYWVPQTLSLPLWFSSENPQFSGREPRHRARSLATATATSNIQVLLLLQSIIA